MIVNLENLEEESANFKNRSPTKWAYIKEFLNRDFYEELYKSNQRIICIEKVLKRRKKQ